MRSWRSWSVAACAAVLVMASVPAAVAAQGGAVGMTLVEGSCGAPGATVAPLVLPSSGTTIGSADAVPLIWATATVAKPLQAIAGEPHAVVVTGSGGAADVVACGDVGGDIVGDTDLSFGIAPVGGSRIAGVGRLHADTADSTTIRVDLLDTGTTGPSGAEPSPAVAATERVSLAGDLYFAGWTIKISSVTVDPVAATLRIEGTYENHSSQELSLLNIQQDGGVRLDWNGTVVEVHFENPVSVPAHGTVAATLIPIYALPEGFSAQDAVLTFGQPTDQGASLPLTAGATGTSVQPQPITFKKKLKLKPGATIAIDGGQLVAADCSGGMDTVYFSTADAGSLSVLLDARIQAGRKDNVSASSFLTGPTGLTSPGTPGGANIAAGDNATDTLCYIVPDYAPGDYTLTFDSGAGKTKVKLTLP
ncbi:MAG: hypothetical protein U0869_02640 [Chloroflexota bacterium]